MKIKTRVPINLSGSTGMTGIHQAATASPSRCLEVLKLCLKKRRARLER